LKPPIVLFEDDYFIAIDKHSGVLSIPDRNHSEADIFSYLKRKDEKLRLIHRIDRETSGVLIFAKSEEAQRELSRQFEHHTIVKKYHAIVAQSPAEPEGMLDNFIDEIPNLKGTYRVAYKDKGKRAISFYKVLEYFKRHSLVEFDIKTGRTHQIRVHAQFLGCPLAYDPLYNPENGIFLSKLKKKYRETTEERSLIQRLSLHAYELNFVHPFSDVNTEIISPYPKDFQKVLEILRIYT
jgi:23S rRNA pseudouridine955/2504/2580 synthase/23S rRNA pseudouridine1911/1915/1917 synthase